MDATIHDVRIEHTIDQPSETAKDGTALTVPLPMPEQVQAAANAGDNAPTDFARNFANGLFADEIEAAKGDVARAELQLKAASEGLGRCEQELRRTPKWQHFLSEWPDYGHRQPLGQRLYNWVRVPVALGGPAIGGGFLVANMMDTSFAMAERPALATLSAGMIAIASLGASSWATMPTTDFQKTETRANMLSVLGMTSFGAWAAFMAIKFGVPAGSAAGVGDFDLTGNLSGTASTAQAVIDWVQSKGASIFALGLHVFGDAMISAGILSSSILAMRKTRRVKTEYTQHHTHLDAERTLWADHVTAAMAAKTSADARVNAAIAKRDAAKELTLQAIRSKKAINAAKRDQSIAAANAQFQGE